MNKTDGSGSAKESIDVCHLTSAHERTDTRIFHKMCRSLDAHGFNVALVVADGKPDDKVGGVRIFGVPKLSTFRLWRILVAPFLFFC